MLMKPILGGALALLVVAGAGMGAEAAGDVRAAAPTEQQMKRAASITLDLRTLAFQGGAAAATGASAPAPAALSSFPGLDFANWGSRRPPDANGDAGPDHYIQAVNTAIGIYRKSDGARVAAFPFDAFMSQGGFGNLCDTDNLGHPVVLYDSFEDRWVISDFAFRFDASFNVLSPPGAFQCFAVSRTGDPVAGGWNFYSLPIGDALNDQTKLGIWPDGIYMSANMHSLAAGQAFEGPRVWALDKAQMYAGEPAVKVVSFNAPVGEFSMLPANARLQTGTPPPGTPNYFSVVWQYAWAVSIYKFHVDWDRTSLSTFTGPFLAGTPAVWLNPPLTVPSRGGSNNTIPARLMPQSQYTNLGGVESLWSVHTVGHPTAAGVTALRWYQATVTGGTVGTSTAQAATYAPDTTNRYVPSLAVDRAGDMAIGYSASSATLFPAIRYVGRLSTDTPSTLPQSETSLVEGTGTQAEGTNWGAYSAMTLDPDGCTFWYTNEYYVANGGDWQTRIASFAYPACSPVVSGTLQGTVNAVGGAPIAGATVTLGSRTATTDGAGFYQFADLPSGTYPSLGASAPGRASSTFASVAVPDGGATTRDFALGAAPASGCVVETSSTDFQTGAPTNVEVTASGDAVLLKPSSVDQRNTLPPTTAFGITTTRWGGQTFTAGVTGRLTRVDLNLFCVNCTGTFPSLRLSLRATSGNLPVGPDIVSAILPGLNSAAPRLFPVTFPSPPMVTAGTVYALVIRPLADPSVSVYALPVSPTSVYAGGQAVWSANSGASWTVPVTAAGQPTDASFKTYVQAGYAASGDLVSSVKDGNPAAGSSTSWGTLAWSATTPAATALRFQVAASNSAAGPFGFVGPDGTAATFFTATGASLGQFNGSRYLAYKAYFSTTDGTATPTLSDVTVCYANTLAP
jgi:hypothetical protein